MADSLSGLKLQVVRGLEAREVSKVMLYKPADFSYEILSRFRSLDPIRCIQKVYLRFDTPSFCLSGPMGSKVEGWLIKVCNMDQVIYLEHWPWEPSFFVYTSGGEGLMGKFLHWLEEPMLHLVKS